MVSAYNKDDAAATFTALAATLEDYARRTAKVKSDNGATSGKAIERCVAAMPDTEPLLSSFAEAVKCADVAHDDELNADMEKRMRELSECWARCDLDAYAKLLRRIAAYVRAVGNAIGTNGTRDDASTDAPMSSQTLKGMSAQVAFLYHDRKNAKEKRRKRGVESYAKAANNADEKRAARDVDEALKRVHGRMAHGETNVREVCRSVCRDFTPTSGKKNALGKAECLPLMKADGKPLKPETLERYYRDKYGSKAKRKANAAANKARTQAARKAKAAMCQQQARRTQ